MSIDSIIDRVTAGEPVDWAQEARLQALYAIKAAEDFASTALRRDRLFDDLAIATARGQVEEAARIIAEVEAL